MTHKSHTLGRIFSRDIELLKELEEKDAHFARLASEYEDVNAKLHRIETEVEPASDEHTEALKKQRLGLLDQLTALVDSARTAS